MNEIEVLAVAPVVFTKDGEWASNHHKVEPGAIIVLPEDAVLYAPPMTIDAPKPPLNSEEEV